LHFNVIELNQAAAAAVGKDVASVQSFRKLAEGGFNRTFELIMALKLSQDFHTRQPIRSIIL